MPSPTSQQDSREPLAAKVPEVAALFWVIKILTTLTGEAISDFLGDGNVAVGGAVEVLILAAALWIQFRVRRYYAWAYWFLALAIATTGTGASDTLHVAIGIPYAGTTALWAVVLAGIFWRWYQSEGTLSIHSIVTRRREKYYWATVFATFALGTALGDLTATSLNLGYLPSGLMFAGIILIPALGWKIFGFNEVAAFWFAYVVTRPLGASFADYISKPHAISGIAFGDGPTAGVATAVVIVLVAYAAIARRDIQASTGFPAPDSTRAPAEKVGAPGLDPV